MDDPRGTTIIGAIHMNGKYPPIQDCITGLVDISRHSLTTANLEAVLLPPYLVLLCCGLSMREQACAYLQQTKDHMRYPHEVSKAKQPR
jgi:hypothetical protein